MNSEEQSRRIGAACSGLGTQDSGLRRVASITVVVRLKWTFDRDADVLCLLAG